MKTADETQKGKDTPDQFYEVVFMTTPVATAIASDSLEIVAFNEAFQDFFQLAEEDEKLPLSAEGLSSSFWKKQDFQQYLHTAMEDNLTQAEKVFDWQHEDGTLKYVELKLRSLSAAQALFMLTFSDITATRQVEKEHNEKIRHMMHELRNPLSNISLCVELLADSTKENNQEDTDMFLSKASASVQRMKQLINDLNAARKAS